MKGIPFKVFAKPNFTFIQDADFSFVWILNFSYLYPNGLVAVFFATGDAGTDVPLREIVNIG